MLVRAKQFFSAVRAEITIKDKTFIHSYLTPKERELFFQMDIPTQKHSLEVAKTCLKLLQKLKHESFVDQELLLKGALLHDIGKPAGGLKTWHRVLIVVAETVLPTSWLDWLAKKSYPFYLQKNHPILGGELAREKQFYNKLITLIEFHHCKLNNNSPIELKLLQQADNLN